MPSPFPGMDPYLEERWSDVHAKLIAFIGEALQPTLPRSLRARSEERVLLEEPSSEAEGEDVAQSYRSDVAIIEAGLQPGGVQGGAAAVLEVEPIAVRRIEQPTIARWVQIIDASNGNRVVTAIEVLSPWNKAPGRLNKTYLRKLHDYERARVSVVEIDLLREPDQSHLEVDTSALPVNRQTPYMVCVRRAWEPDVWQAYPLPLQLPLPRIPVPLRRTDAEILLALQPLMERIYIAGGHDDIDYAKPLKEPLPPAEAAWMADRLRIPAPNS